MLLGEARGAAKSILNNPCCCGVLFTPVEPASKFRSPSGARRPWTWGTCTHVRLDPLATPRPSPHLRQANALWPHHPAAAWRSFCWRVQRKVHVVSSAPRVKQGEHTSPLGVELTVRQGLRDGGTESRIADSSSHDGPETSERTVLVSQARAAARACGDADPCVHGSCERAGCGTIVERALLTKRWPSAHKIFPTNNDPTNSNYNKIAAIWMQLCSHTTTSDAWL